MENPNNLMEQEKRLKVIFLAMLLGQLALAAAVSLLASPADAPEHPFLPYLAAAILIKIHLIAFYFFNNRKQKIAQLEAQPQFIVYQKATITRWAMLESGNLLMLVAAFVTGNNYYLMLFAVGLLLFARTKPDFNFG
jgi:hypothetical protein